MPIIFHTRCGEKFKCNFEAGSTLIAFHWCTHPKFLLLIQFLIGESGSYYVDLHHNSSAIANCGNQCSVNLCQYLVPSPCIIHCRHVLPNTRHLVNTGLLPKHKTLLWTNDSLGHLQAGCGSRGHLLLEVLPCFKHTFICFKPSIHTKT